LRAGVHGFRYRSTRGERLRSLRDMGVGCDQVLPAGSAGAPPASAPADSRGAPLVKMAKRGAT